MSCLDETRLENVSERAGYIICRCPACFEQGHDKTGNHLSISPEGRFTCVQFPGGEGKEHRKHIFELIGLKGYETLEHGVADQECRLKMKATRRDPYNDQFVVVRFDDPEKRKTKEFRPFHLSASRWLLGDPPGKLPLFNLAELRKRPTEKVYLVEGEKCALTLRDELGLLATTSAHGAKAAHKTDWTPLAGRKVVILPDADDEGERYASKAANALLNLEQPARIRIVQLPELPPKGDCVDWLQSRNGQSREDTIAQLEALVAAAAEAKKERSQAVPNNYGGLKNLDAYLENDGGNAEMFVDRFGEIVRYSHAHQSWFIWDGNRWLPDARENVHQLASELSKTLAADLLNTPGRPDPQKLKRAIVMGSQNKISAALWLARSAPRIVIRREQIDADNFLLGARNGVIDLRTGLRRSGQKGDFITKACGCDFDPEATAPRWTDFLLEIFNDQTDLIDYIQRAAGYSITGDTREQCIFFPYGGGANGKSTFIEVLVALAGDYATTASQNVLCDNHYGREPLDEIASLEGARLVSIAETGAEHMAEVRIKQLTGGDTVTGKAHYKAAASFQPKFKLWIFGNSKPAIYGVDYAIWRRIKLIPFTVQFPPDKQDKELKEKLLAELPGILNWAIQGALNWQAEGQLVPPECVVKATEAYREESDILKEFIDENVVREQNAEVSHKDLFKRYKNWSEQRGEKPFSSKKLAKLLRERNYHERTDWSGLHWSQIKLSDET